MQIRLRIMFHIQAYNYLQPYNYLPVRLLLSALGGPASPHS